jgi:hypothetical protein
VVPSGGRGLPCAAKYNTAARGASLDRSLNSGERSSTNWFVLSPCTHMGTLELRNGTGGGGAEPRGPPAKPAAGSAKHKTARCHSHIPVISAAIWGGWWVGGCRWWVCCLSSRSPDSICSVQEPTSSPHARKGDGGGGPPLASTPVDPAGRGYGSGTVPPLHTLFNYSHIRGVSWEGPWCKPWVRCVHACVNTPHHHHKHRHHYHPPHGVDLPWTHPHVIPLHRRRCPASRLASPSPEPCTATTTSQPHPL